MDRSRYPVQVRGQAMGWSKKSTSAKLFLSSHDRCIFMRGWQKRARGFEHGCLVGWQKHLVLFPPPETNGYCSVMTRCAKTALEAWERTSLSLMNLSPIARVCSEQAHTYSQHDTSQKTWVVEVPVKNSLTQIIVLNPYLSFFNSKILPV